MYIWYGLVFTCTDHDLDRCKSMLCVYVSNDNQVSPCSPSRWNP